MTKELKWVLAAIVVLLVLGFGYKAFAIVDEEALQCEPGEHVESVLVTPAVAGTDGTPAVTHTEEQTSCEYKGDWTFGYNSQCNGQWQFRQHAYHEVTVEVEVVDEPAVEGTEGTPAVYEDLCVPDEEDEDTDETPSESGSSAPHSTLKGGGGMCQPNPAHPECNQPANFAYHAKLGTYAKDQQIISLYQQLIDALNKWISLL